MHPQVGASTGAATPPADVRSTRLVVLVSATVVAAWGVAVHTWRPADFWPAAMLRAVPGVVGVSILVVLALTHGRGWHRSTELARVRPGALVVPPNGGLRWFVAAQVQVLTFVTVPMLDLGAVGRESPGALDVLTPSLVVAGLLLLGWLVAIALAGRPRIELTPDAVHVRDLFGSWTVPWTALRPGTPDRQGDDRALPLPVARPELVRRRGLGFGSRRRPVVPLRWLDVHPWFLADVLRWYADQPAERASIGTAEGYARLRRALGAR